MEEGKIKSIFEGKISIDSLEKEGKKYIEKQTGKMFADPITSIFASFAKAEEEDQKRIGLFSSTSPAGKAITSASKMSKDIRQKSIPTIDSIFSKGKKMYENTMKILNPGQTWIEPALKEKGVDPKLAFGIGLGLDIITPMPGELSRAKKGTELLSKGAKMPIEAFAALPFLPSSVKNQQSTVPSIFEDRNKDLVLTEDQKNYQIKNRNVEISSEDLRAAAPIIFAEISNRTLDKAELETRVILNTAINRMNEYREKGKDFTLKEILEMPNQYQGFGSKEYEKHNNPNSLFLDKKKKKLVEDLLKKIEKEFQQGIFEDNTGGAVYYIHKSNGEIRTSPGKLFK